jgi:hypothetical protein
MGDANEVTKNMLTLQNRIKANNLIWLVIPDKETVYMDRDISFWTISQAQSKSVDVLSYLKKAVNAKEIDVNTLDILPTKSKVENI